MQICVVCSEKIPKYRCPVCRIRYCSLGCFKKHKSDDSCQPVKDVTPPAPCPASSQSAAEPWTVDYLLDENSQSDRVPLQKLQLLGESKDLKTLLQNPHLRNLMLTVDSAEDKSKAMKDAMQEPLFVELANQCLQIIEPTEIRDDDDDE
ncbi:zinc finger HIT domain-containing protein 3 [Ictalurus punctatus]|uniref:Zinc finger HIT domain-containing protein 3 n=1 Tax=Ictalurus punctatus TaxID=7998 RepID=E3TG50_ICTPU|nr:zinc finger HIT domain-containing protein 3 [Ictalurus punctatus]ADO29286.1 zinc finger hit domain-containing protein 3 [Ictalurus punctatus]